MLKGISYAFSLWKFQKSVIQVRRHREAARIGLKPSFGRTHLSRNIDLNIRLEERVGFVRGGFQHKILSKGEVRR